MILFTFDTGCRISEISGIRIMDLDANDNKGYFDESYTKGNKSRRFYLDK